MSASASPNLHLRINSDTVHLRPVREKIEAFATAAGFDQVAVGEIGLVVNEAMANVIRHAYHGKTDQPVEISASLDPKNVLRIGIRDWGTGKKPAGLPTEVRDPLNPGGLGLVCMGRLMDKVSFTPQRPGMLLEMERSLKR